MRRKLKRRIRGTVDNIESFFVKRGVRPPFGRRAPSVESKLSLVVPTYNVERYIDKLFISLMRQTTGLQNVEIIVVDDGSTDASGEIAKKWQKAYPETIKYVWQENQGLSGARNTGLRHATGDWVSFPDPDDFVTPDYFEHVSAEIEAPRDKPLLMVACNLLPYRETQGRASNTHPLRYRFADKRTVLPSHDLGKFVHLSSAAAWFNLEYVRKSGFVFDGRIKPSFEDAHWVNRLLLEFPETEVAFLREPKYFHFKRADESSLTGGANLKKSRYLEEMRYAYVDLIAQARAIRGHVPRFIQRVILYHIFGQFVFLIDKPERLNFLTKREQEEYFQLMRQTFDGIDIDTINTYDLPDLHEEHKVGLLALFKGASRPVTRAYLMSVDEYKGLVQFAYFSKSPVLRATAEVNGNETDVLFTTSRTATYMNEPFFHEHRFWVSLRRDEDYVLVHVDGQRNSPISVHGGLIPPAPTMATLKSRFRRPVPASLPRWVRKLRSHASSEAAKIRFGDCWLFMDRDDKADDNAEHLYRYVLKNHPEVNAYFILRRTSPDWPRLEREGFSLIEFNSNDHYASILNAKVLASSHIDHFVFWPVRRRYIEDLVSYKFMFLQHGVTKDDISRWINPLQIHLLTTATFDEHDSFVGQGGNFLVSEKEVRLTGFARHDALQNLPQTRRSIVIMPTWRKFLVGPTIGDGAQRERSEALLSSEYFRRWKSVLTSPKLAELARKHGLEIVFCPHPNMAIYSAEFANGADIKVVNPLEVTSLQQLFASAAMMVTDYSSVAFDVAYLNKPIAYYQFDEEQVFGGEHAYHRGYFDYRRHGFGPVATEEQQLLDSIRDALEGRERPEYEERRMSTFAYRDGKCCQRIVEAILDLFAPRQAEYLENKIAAAAERASILSLHHSLEKT